MTDTPAMKNDPGLYDYWPYVGRPKLTWPGGARVAFWVAPNIEYYELDPPINPSRAPWPRPAPDVLTYAQRDYGNRAGHWRMMEVMDRFGVRGSVSLNVALCEHHPEIIEACVARDYDFLGHCQTNVRWLNTVAAEDERGPVEDLRAASQVERAAE